MSSPRYRRAAAERAFGESTSRISQMLLHSTLEHKSFAPSLHLDQFSLEFYQFLYAALHGRLLYRSRAARSGTWNWGTGIRRDDGIVCDAASILPGKIVQRRM